MKRGLSLLAAVIMFAATSAWAGSFTDNGDSTVTDSDTGLMWQQATASGSYDWEAALSYCEDLTPPAAVYSDWRLPNVKELESLTDDNQSSPAIDTTLFADTFAADYWSSTTYSAIPTDAMVVVFLSGEISSFPKTDNLRVRCVR